MTEVRNDPDGYRFEARVDGRRAGFAEYRAGPRVRAFVHTFVEERFRGKGVSEELVARALDETRREGLAVEPFCSFVRSFIAEHPEYLDLVPQDRRDRFDLRAA